MQRFFKPDHARVGDTIPYFHDGVFHVFYLKRYADDTHDRIQTDWWHLTTTDFVAFDEVGTAVRRGGPDDADYSAATGSVIRIGDTFFAYSTGFAREPLSEGARHQTILRWRSPDLLTWEKDQDFALVADTERYDANEWRDPSVFHDAEAGVYRMLVAGELRDGPAHRRGATVQATSVNGLDWEIGDPLWAPGLFSAHECPDLFRIGEYWYLVYSTLTDRTVTRYRMASSLDGPWLAPDDDELDGLGLYAAKTVTDGTTRYLVGWCPNATGGVDGASWLWGGNLIVHELHQLADGRLAVRQNAAARAVLERSTDGPAVEFAGARVGSAYGYATHTLATMPHAGFADLTLDPDAKVFGLELRTDNERAHGYRVSFEPALRRFRIDRIDRFGADAPYDNRPLDLPAGPLRLALEFDGEITVVYVNGLVAATLRGYDLQGSQLGVFVEEGAVVVESGSVHPLQQTPKEDR
ncbi:beta-fructofuranosidase [Microbacterium sp. ru370.1]|uniref:GH32 C-terminal domain-containing protein n=1 Tax=unclassified Microbacterium TaxID=2609290 RepID=UPI0008883632|nr:MULTISPECIES: GH32 C-terminal domain-containing protein [unclassified Microbacterium]SDO99065.1 beta-fructofuranosidase [Microbacterium sp. ru370.1]SIT92490.1 beta-fructofuranosidase [Microbacterium sp. RU1D]